MDEIVTAFEEMHKINLLYAMTLLTFGLLHDNVGESKEYETFLSTLPVIKLALEASTEKFVELRNEFPVDQRAELADALSNKAKEIFDRI